MSKGHLSRLRLSWPVCFLLLLVAAICCYAPALDGPFLWDDRWLVLENPLIKSPLFVFETFRHYLFLDSLSAYYRPVQNISYILDYAVWGMEPFGYHLTNILLHTLVALLFYRLVLVLQLVQARSAAFLLALLWLVHPVHSAAVAYISGRADALACLFAIAAWLLYSSPAKTGTRAAARDTGAAILLFLALCSKEIALVWVALFLMYEFSRQPRKWSGQLGALAVVLLYFCMRELLGDRPAARNAAVPLPARLHLALAALGDYTRLLLFPDRLQMERRLSDSLFWLGALALALFLVGSLHKAPGRKLRRIGALWFFTGFLPISNLFPLNAPVAEHWIYMPSMGGVLFFAGCAPMLPSLGRVGRALCLLAVLGLALRCYIRSGDWSDPERFFKQTIASGGASPRILANLANVHRLEGNYTEAERVLRELLAASPGFLTARIDLGRLLLQTGKPQEAEELLRAIPEQANAIKQPYTWRASLELVRLHLARNERARALQILEEASQQHAEIWDFIKVRAQLLEKQEAERMLAQYVAKNWWHYDARLCLGSAQLANGKTGAASASWRSAAWLDVHSAEPYQLLARLELARGDLPKALEAQLKAIRRQPDQPSQFLVLASIYEMLDLPAKAAEANSRAEKLREMTSGDR